MRHLRSRRFLALQGLALAVLWLVWPQIRPAAHAEVSRTVEAISLAHGEPPVDRSPASPPGRMADRVVIVSMDGLRPDALGAHTPNMLRLQREGAYARAAYTITKSVTLPSHASMLTGVGMDKHRLNFNHFLPGRGPVKFPTVMAAAHDAGLETSLFVGKQKLELLVQGREVDRVKLGGVICTKVNRDALPHLAEVHDGIHFVHYGDPDAAGHRYGWMSDVYRKGVARADRCLGELMHVLEGRGDLSRTLLIVTADHGGHGRTHGTPAEVDRRIPWLAWGGLTAPIEIVDPVDTRDTAATALAALALPPPAGIEGRPVTDAFR